MNGQESFSVPADGSPLQQHVEKKIAQLRDDLRRDGTLVEESGTFQANRLRGSLHTNLGPPEQDKEINQDYALAWYSWAPCGPLPLALALADGLTSSFGSEWAARLACWHALAELHKRCVVQGAQALAPEELAKEVFREAQQALVDFHSEMKENLEGFRPNGIWPATWRYMLDKGQLLQTTLSVLWVQGGQLYIAILGDGGVLCRLRSSGDKVFLGSSSETQEVRALGPAEPSVEEFDHWAFYSLDELSLVALYTDGIGRGILEAPTALLDELQERLRARPPHTNAAREVIEGYKQERAAEFQDNLTLAVILVMPSRTLRVGHAPWREFR